MKHDKRENFFEENGAQDNVKRYEAMLSQGQNFYFDVDDYMDIVEHYIDKDLLKNAQEACRNALNLHPGASELKLKHAQLFVSRGKPVKALEWLNKASELRVSNHEYYLTKGISKTLLGETEQAEKLFVKAFTLVPEDEKEDLVHIVGQALEESENHDLAIRFYKFGVKYYPENRDFLFRLAINLDKEGYNDQSEKCYQKLLDSNPFAENVWYNLGILYNKTEDFEQAIEAYDYTLALDGGHFDALFNKANTWANWGKYEEAISCYTEYLQIHEESLTALFYLGECYVQIREYDKAMQQFRDALKIHVEYPEAYYGMGLVYSELEKNKEAQDMFKMVLSLDHEHLDALYSLSLVLNKEKAHKDAIHYLGKLLALNPYDIEAWLLMAHCLDAMGEEQKVILQLTSAVNNNHESSELTYALAAYMIKAGFIDSGINWFKIAYDKSKDYSLVQDIYPDALNVLEIFKLINQKES